jgi:checkpoint serine/threonine-protein kinase
MDLWNTLFDLLLNPAAHSAVPITAQLAGVRARIETFLEENCQKNGKSLKQLLKRIELRAMEGR